MATPQAHSKATSVMDATIDAVLRWSLHEFGMPEIASTARTNRTASSSAGYGSPDHARLVPTADADRCGMQKAIRPTIIQKRSMHILGFAGTTLRI